jgi:hypothetical protein
MNLISATSLRAEVAQRIVTAIEQAQAPKQSHQPRLILLGYGDVTLPTRRWRAVKIRHVEPEGAGLLVDLFNRLSPPRAGCAFLSPSLPSPRVLPRQRSRAWLELTSTKRRRCWRLHWRTRSSASWAWPSYEHYAI